MYKKSIILLCCLLTFLLKTSMILSLIGHSIMDVRAKGDGFAVRANLFYLMRFAYFFFTSHTYPNFTCQQFLHKAAFLFFKGCEFLFEDFDFIIRSREVFGNATLFGNRWNLDLDVFD